MSADPPGPPEDDETRLAPDSPEGSSSPTSTSRPDSSGAPRHEIKTPRVTASGTQKSVTSSSGWLSSSGAIDHGRFPPGTLLGGRYRIVGRLGRGGMGEVFRADDLKLGQPVALKFLPPDVDRDPARLTQLHTEVRMARQVSHPNVCRVYDIDEVEGHTFLSMEYVDGEDLASLLRRIGRFPEDRALAIARQICAGLAAAHERDVIHRDFKPANVMLDAGGKVRITDFGLAGVTGESIRAGTPAYMAPEQLAGGEVTARSDIYALGLVLYEIFTGQRALDGQNVAELIRKREQSGIVPPSDIVRDLNPDIERAIMRCLRPDPDERPASALIVAASLPGGDPLAAALAAGETPSPDMVAAAGGSAAISTRAAAAGAIWVIVSLIALVFLYERVFLLNRVPLPKPPEALADRAQEIVARLGYGTGVRASASGFDVSEDYIRFVARQSTAPDRWRQLASARPESVVLWHRTSPRLLIPWGAENNVAGVNPPLSVSGMTLAIVDASGRLVEFHAVPEVLQADTTHGATDWARLFDAAGLPMPAFSPVAPRWLPLTYADERRAWEGTLPEQPDHPFRVEAAGYGGRAVYLAVTGPWSQSARAQPRPPGGFQRAMAIFSSLIMPALMLTGAVLAVRNVRMGRGDRRGAFRAAAVIFIASLFAWMLGASHVADPGVEIGRIFAAIGRALFDAGVLWMTYLGLEPYIRRSSPDSMIGWTRLIAGSWRDPRVGTDILIGIAVGLAMTLIFAVHNLLPPLMGRPEPMPVTSDERVLQGLRFVFAGLISQVSNAISSGMLGVVGIVALLVLLKRRWAAIVAGIVCYTPVVINGMFPEGTPLLDIVSGALIISVFIGVIVRFGLLAAVAALATHFILLRAPLTTDLGSWRGPAALWYLGVLAAAGFGACYIAAGGGRKLGRLSQSR